MHPVDRIFQAVSQASRLVQLRDMVKEALAITHPKCGRCQGWMTNTCPREGNANGRRTGPSCNGPACEEFEINSWLLDLQKERAEAAVAFAKQHGLPVPPAFASQSI